MLGPEFWSPGRRAHSFISDTKFSLFDENENKTKYFRPEAGEITRQGWVKELWETTLLRYSLSFIWLKQISGARVVWGRKAKVPFSKRMRYEAVCMGKWDIAPHCLSSPSLSCIFPPFPGFATAMPCLLPCDSDRLESLALWGTRQSTGEFQCPLWRAYCSTRETVPREASFTLLCY